MIPENLADWSGKKIVIALSGGVDSAAAALLLKRAGADARAVFMKNWTDDDTAAACHDKDDLMHAAAAAEKLRLPFDVVNFAGEYRARVFAPFLAELRRGRTPNPDVLCNAEIKFAALDDYARAQGAQAVATGHYARRRRLDGVWQLCKGEDAAKDQSYFLHRLSAAQLARAVFPLGGMHKAEVRALARDAGLDNWARKDSTGICFIGERPFAAFLRRYLPATPGDIADESGRVLGAHDGLPFYTIGQRKGLGLPGGPWFVYEKCGESNRLRVTKDENSPLLMRDNVGVQSPHWIAGAPPPENWVYSARLRHRQTPASCTLTRADAAAAHIIFAEPQRAVTPGQYAVLYDGNICLGGGAIAGGSGFT